MTSYAKPGPIRLLTEPGYSYGGQRDGKPFCISADGRMLITSRCNLTQVGECVVYLLSESNTDGDRLPRSTILCKLTKNACVEKLMIRSPEPTAGKKNFFFLGVIFFPKGFF